MTFAAAHPADTEALRDQHRAWTWAQVDDELRPLVNALLTVPCRPTRRVAVFAGNSGQTLLTYVACTLAGASAVAVNSHLAVTEAAYIFESSQADLVLVDEQTQQLGSEAARLAGVPLVVGPATREAWLAAAGDAEPRTDHSPLRTVVYTSGSTGRPKGVELPLTSWVGGDDITQHVARLAEVPLVQHGRHLVVGPLYHSGPLTGTRLLLGGAPVTVLGPFDAERWLHVVERDRIRSTIVVPTHLQRVLGLPAEVRESYDVSSLAYVLQVGAKFPEAAKRQAVSWLGDALWESYGASEVGTTCMISGHEWLGRPGSVGRSVPPFEAVVLDAEDRPAPAGQQGRLFFRDTSGHGLAYLGEDTPPDPLFTLGEIGLMDEQGYVWITDRASDLVVSGGVNIYPAEAELVLAQHPAVVEVACLGDPHEELGELLVAVVVADGELDPDELLQWCRERLSLYKCPRRITLVPSLPRTAVGKLDRRALRSVVAERVLG